ncbi:DUF1804 family protein [Serratia marcescens]|nr:DUF1804 family protein [Serratia marcescens]MDQ9403586.1 DUF1804 family protein [Serratia marcescens]MDQ9543869.1 DUF1804 family protein [Serratia marcescens]MDQ9566828.1 DUF1804 family protein [Serratia marcescens]MDQ9657282.1 DUF1804 family protein [Serratia marcescens]MDQ9698493.1 DUF1804 family protein [Serratia marcescens]
MAYPPETRDRLRRAYVFDGLSLEVAAVQCGVSYGTAQRWKNDSKAAGDDWETLRGARMLAGGGLEELTWPCSLAWWCSSKPPWTSWPMTMWTLSRKTA